ncbi:uncharacterized protein PHACADRAFT_109377 [Phanerochaete carnosa HHB-10118-sp]|uniref:F-box domain-containing protein n=1 Tax=Phanerochaete carnosa (strain HHB-10118-sp) TaxID=650164 RepID=K5VAK5_PHACS|nr:uncharacterized protein PHACADRAFT_109377 [Phanerochaete carnosa HHB-10118-sp]EKM48118.1 hypothetical protein PHACADRAFT_109377 [Phanerochaete carnosa HHB-10118-sp]
MSRATGADLPPEVLSYILQCVPPYYLWLDLDERRELKRGLAGPALVCKHWSEDIRPTLFQELELRSAEDVRFLKNIVSSPGFAASCLSGSIRWIYIRQEATGAKPWLHHVHGLSTRLQGTKFRCVVKNRAGDAASTAGRWAPFESIPTVTPSYIRLSSLILRDVVFASKTELIRLVDNFPTLEDCYCERLTFLDPLPPARPRRLRRRSPPTRHNFLCTMSYCKDMVAPIQAALATDIVDPARLMGLDDRTWDTSLQGLLALAPRVPGRVDVSLDGDMPGRYSNAVEIHCYSLSPGQPAGPDIIAEVRFCRSSAGQDAGPTLAHIESIDLELLLGDVGVADTLPWDGLRPVIDSPHMRRLCIKYYAPENGCFEGAKKVLCSVLRRSQLTWALESGKLQFERHFRPENSVTREDILSVPTKHTIDGTTITLDIAEQAEWLLRPVHARSEEHTTETREHYLRELVTNRPSGPSTDAASGTAPPTADGAQDTAVEQTWEAAEGDGPVGEQGEETGDVGDEESI